MGRSIAVLYEKNGHTHMYIGPNEKEDLFIKKAMSMSDNGAPNILDIPDSDPIEAAEYIKKSGLKFIEAVTDPSATKGGKISMFAKRIAHGSINEFPHFTFGDELDKLDLTNAINDYNKARCPTVDGYDHIKSIEAFS